MARSPTETIRFLTLDELARLLAVMRGHPRDRALFLIAYRHGLRASEIGLLRLEDLDFRALRLRIHRLKGSHSGVHPMQPDEAKTLCASHGGAGQGCYSRIVGACNSPVIASLSKV
jgi:integrase